MFDFDARIFLSSFFLGSLNFNEAATLTPCILRTLLRNRIFHFLAQKINPQLNLLKSGALGTSLER
jgi:hypothetical protein